MTPVCRVRARSRTQENPGVESFESTPSTHGSVRRVFGTAMENVHVNDGLDEFDVPGGNEDTSMSIQSHSDDNGCIVLLPPTTSFSTKGSKFSRGESIFSAQRGNAKSIMENSNEESHNRVDSMGPSGVPQKDLHPVNPYYENFHSKLVTRQVRHLLYEIGSDGTAVLREFSTRELCTYINECVDHSVNDPPPVDKGSNSTVAYQEAANGTEFDEMASPTASTSSYPSSSRQSGGGVSDVMGWKKNNKCSSVPRKTRVMSLGSYTNSFHLRHRDLRILFTENHSSEPCVAVRRGVVLVHMESIRAIVLWNKVFLIVDDGADSVLGRVEEQMSGNSSYDSLPDFELRAYETIMNVSMSHLMYEVKCLEPKVKEIVHLMENENHAATSAESNNKFRSLMNDVNEVLSRTRAHQRAILAILDEDADLAFMYLTKMTEQPQCYMLPLDQTILEQHDEVEVLFENCLQDASSLINVLEITKDRMRNTEALIKVKLDIARNRLLTADTLFGMVAMCSGFGALFSGIMGMNLEDGWDFSNLSFFITVFLIVGFSVIVGSVVFIRLQRDGIWVR